MTFGPLGLWWNWREPYYGLEVSLGQRSVWIGWTAREWKRRGW